MSFDPNELARDAIRRLKPYESARSSAGAGEFAVLLDANESPFEGEAAPGTAGLNRYPEPQPRELLGLMARYYGVRPDQILITRGADEGIDVLPRCFCEPGKDRIISCPPTFDYYRIVAEIQGAEHVEIPLREDFGLDTAGILAAAKRKTPKIVYLCSPNNPTGNDMPRDEIIGLADALSDSLVVVDEAYIEFSEQPSFAREIDARPNIVVIATLSKAFGLAAARCGALVADARIVDIAKRVLAPYAVPAPVRDAAIAALGPAGLLRMEYQAGRIRELRDELARALAKLAQVEKVWPTSTNFVLARFKDAGQSFAELSAKGIRVRDFSGEIAGALRISVGTDEENALLLAALGANLPAAAPARRGEYRRETRETSIFAAVDLDGPGGGGISTGLAFFDHMLDQLRTHGGFALTLGCKGDLKIDAHHTVEDCAIALGNALDRALGDRAGIGRYGFTLPMDEARAEALVDLSGRPLCRFDCEFKAERLGELPTQMIPHFFRSLADNLGAAIHISVTGENDHHKCEAAFKALGRALRPALARDGRALPSTKGVL